MNWFLLFLVVLIGVVLYLVFRPKPGQDKEADPLAEAEVYIAYGKTEKAIALLERALQENPQRADIAEKLRSLKSS